MRWKLQTLASLAMSVAAILLYSAARRVETGSFSQRDPWAGSAKYLLAIPLIMACAAAFFVYRHTSRRRKTQATLTFGLTLLFTYASIAGIDHFL
ncbi:MAG: hypothetical protein ABIZ95_21050 [Pyrinomonadaceae bacterium]